MLFGCAERRFEAQQRYASTVARQVPLINEREKENCQSSILNCQLKDRPRSGERAAEERSEAAGASLSERSEFAARTAKRRDGVAQQTQP